jgi:hypothetical protein
VTVIVSVKINDGVIMAADSASIFDNGQTYLTADKIVNLVKGLPIGVMVTGSGGIGSESITTLFKDLRKRLDGSTKVKHAWALDPEAYTISAVADRVREFLFSEKVDALGLEAWMRLRICGYSAGRPLPEIWEVLLQGRQCEAPTMVQPEDQVGPRWDGEYDALDRLFLGFGTQFGAALTTIMNVQPDQLDGTKNQFLGQLSESVVLAAMPVQDAIDLARYMVETTIGFVRFSIRKQPKTVGGAVEIAAITKHEGFRWVQRRHFYPASLNPPPATP